MKKFKKLLGADTEGFTLIELMIVIVIIGIMSGVLISILNPVAAQNKARDANTKASINKLALGVSAFVSAEGRIPNEVEFLSEFQSISANGVTCATATDATCQFAIIGSALPTGGTAGCSNAANWGGSGVNQCFYYYCGTGATDMSTACAYTNTTTTYRIAAKSFGTANVYMFNSADSKFYLCAADGTSCAAAY